MHGRPTSRLNRKTRYLQLAFNSTLEDARAIIPALPQTDRILYEAGTPLLKRYGMHAIREIRALAMRDILSAMSASARSPLEPIVISLLTKLIDTSRTTRANGPKATPAPIPSSTQKNFSPYIVADMKTIDRGAAEVEMCASAGASAVVAMGSAPIETLNAFIAACEDHGVDAMIDMMNVEYPVTVLGALKKKPAVVILHRGVDEERDNREKRLPLHEIRRVKGSGNSLVAIAGGDTPREVQSAVFNDADIVVVWKAVYQSTGDTLALVQNFLKEIK